MRRANSPSHPALFAECLTRARATPRDGGGGEALPTFHARVPFPLPRTLAVLAAGDWDLLARQCAPGQAPVAAVDLVLASDFPPKRLGRFDSGTCALCAAVTCVPGPETCRYRVPAAEAIVA